MSPGVGCDSTAQGNKVTRYLLSLLGCACWLVAIIIGAAIAGTAHSTFVVDA